MDRVTAGREVFRGLLEKNLDSSTLCDYFMFGVKCQCRTQKNLYYNGSWGVRLCFEKPKIPRISPGMHMDSLTTKHFLHFALPGLWKVIIPVKNRPIWPDPSQPHQIKKWIITFHRHGRAKPKYVLWLGGQLASLVKFEEFLFFKT